MLRWLLTLWQESWAGLLLTVFSQSDIAFHGYLLWSTVQPVKAPAVTPHRGSYCLVGEYWWPLPLNWIEQQQAGNTTPHTFSWNDWLPGQTRYAMLFPSSDPTFQASTSPIWAITAPYPLPWDTVITEPWTEGLYPWIPEPDFTILVIDEPWTT